MKNFVFLIYAAGSHFQGKLPWRLRPLPHGGNYEIDFYVKSIKGQHTYAVEVKSGKTAAGLWEGYWRRRKRTIFLYAKKEILMEELRKISIPYRFMFAEIPV